MRCSCSSLKRMGFDDRFQRMWDFYLAWCEGSFRERHTNVDRLTLAKQGTQQAVPSDALAARLAAAFRLKGRPPKEKGRVWRRAPGKNLNPCNSKLRA